MGDFFPTFLNMGGHPGVTDRIIDGKDLTSILFNNEGEEQIKIHDFLFHWCGNTLHAVSNGEYKMHWITPTWDEGKQHCDSVVICQCAGRNMVYHSSPLLYNIRLDPGEKNLISPDSEEYKKVFEVLDSARKEHEKSIVAVPNQLESFPRPWIMPCCNRDGNDCSCYENNNDYEYLLA